MISFSSFTLIEGIACAIALQVILTLWFIKKQHQQKALSESINEKIQHALTTHCTSCIWIWLNHIKAAKQY
ncbi:transmembrane protein [Legionella quateirensis]|uniref:Transmembrane protein n=1 Tax=Legionella quateirensis TaxID=45072 RepID=A0A378PAK0_9GAMM|nr:transmembrane protein [Legionella quateirensis]